MDLPHRLARAVDIPVRHVECTPNEDLAAAVDLAREQRNAISSVPQPVADQTIAERWRPPTSSMGKMANGPPGKNRSWATLLWGRSWNTAHTMLVWS